MSLYNFAQGVMAGASADQQYLIEQSLLFNAADSPSLTWTPSVAADSDKIITMCFQFKRGTGDTVRWLYDAGSNNDQIQFEAGNALEISLAATVGAYLKTTQIFRDYAAWSQMVVAFDTTQAAAADRIKLWLDGKRVTAFSTETYPSLNYSLEFVANSVQQNIGRRGNNSQFFDGALAEFILIDGTAYDETAFGKFDANGNWNPINPSGLTFGTNGFWLDFANSAAFGNDVSGNNNDFTPSGLTTTDQLLDSPTNDAANDVGNYFTFNPLDDNGFTFSEGNRRIVADASIRTCRMGHGPASGKWFARFVNDGTGNDSIVVGLFDDSEVLPSTASGSGIAASVSKAISYRFSSGAIYKDGTIGTTYTASTAQNDTIDVAWDADTGEVWIAVNDTWQNSGDPAAGTGEVGTLTAGPNYVLAASAWDSNSLLYEPELGTPPTGFNRLCTAHLSDPAILDPSAQFAVVTDTETNIVATLAAETNATNYVRVYKNRDSIENWYWQFSHDNSNAYSVALSSSTSVAFPTLSGGDAFMGAEFNCDTYFKTGSVAHTNGADTTVTHNAGNARVFILLFDRTNGGDIISYHPEYTAGKLNVFNNSVGETVDVAIKNVTTNTFDIDTGEATGTRDYLVIPETAGFVELGLYVGNGSTDGPFDPADLRPALSINHRIDAASGYDWNWWNAASTPYNKPNPEILSLTSNAAESFYGDFDILSNGRKERSTQGNGNASGGSYVTIHIAEAPFKYARAR
jgi:hypothetical protein